MSESINNSSYNHPSVSFTPMPPGVLGSRINSVEDIQISLAPHIQEYLTRTSRRHSCCSVMLPVPFERAGSKAWINPHFDSAVLEGQYLASIFPQIRLRFRFALIYILLSSLAWLLYFLAGGGPSKKLLELSISLILVSLFCVVVILITNTWLYRAHSHLVAGGTAFIICFATLCFMAFAEQALSPLGHFAICIEIIFLIYTVFPFPFWACIMVSVSYSITFEVLSYVTHSDYSYDQLVDQPSSSFFHKILVIRILLQVCVHLAGMHVLVMSVVRMRGTFMKVGQNLLVRRQLEMEKQLKEKMIHSMMPPSVAEKLMRESGATIEQDIRPRSSHPSDLKSLFRPFHMNKMNDVSILFADIVGFTKMSSNKTAEQLVEILNDLFERFDYLCMINRCEKISTLGDCYYCVSGCPEPRTDHAVCCVEMGLGMIQAMKSFDSQRHEGVTMRVGVHTGSVLCGIVGTKRVKFDVWSNDVTLANKMESTGRPGHVHISEETRNFLGDSYFLEDGDEVFGHKTFFVLGRMTDQISRQPSQINLRIPETSCVPATPDGSICGIFHMSQSATNLSSLHVVPLHVPPASPCSANPSITPNHRPRLRSIGRISACFPLHTDTTSPELSAAVKVDIESRPAPPKILINTGSFEMDDDDDDNKDDDHETEEKTATVNGKVKLLGWKLPIFRHTTATTTVNNHHQQKLSDSVEVVVKNCDKSEEVPCNTKKGSVGSESMQLQPLLSAFGPRASCHALDIPVRLSRSASKTQANYLSTNNNIMTDNNSSTSQNSNSLFDDIIDIRSYISQSRSDISPFARTGSYRSQGANHSIQLDVPQMGRPRSSTIASNCVELPLDHSWALGDSVFLGANSTNSAGASRKDSGIRSNSRRSSIQHTLYTINPVEKHKTSGYFTSSQSSLCVPPEPVPVPYELNDHTTHPDPLGACLQQLRKQSDLQLIRCVRDNARSQNSYLVKPPLSLITLFFKSAQLESEFRSKAHRLSCDQSTESPPTLATPRYNTYLDILTSFLFYLLISLCLFLLCPGTYLNSYRVWVCIFVCFTCIHMFALFLCSKQVCRRISGTQKPIESPSVFRCISNWYPWHITGALLLSLPVISILFNFATMNVENFQVFEFHYGFLFFVAILHFCNFTQLNCWWRNFLALISSVTFIGIAMGHMYRISCNNNSGSGHGLLENVTAFDAIGNDTNATDFVSRTSQFITPTEIDWFDSYRIEIYLDLFLLLFLAWILNREFEIGYRLSFYGSAIANQDKLRVQNMKNQADLLLHNIIPKYVAEELKCTAKYSKNHQDAGIVFASIVNFNEMYDESYLGGKEYLRVLNELIGDFDELLDRPEFKSVEKIKTIGSSFMCASGLNPMTRGDNNEHLIALLDFAIAMQAVIDNFNRDLIEFNLILRIGFNIGDVTAGVIGTSKLYYDIWGDAVNIASRMDSTGVPGRIQVSSHCLQFLEKYFDFESRGSVYVKGKDNMDVYLLKCKKPEPDYSLPEIDDQMD